MNLYASYEDKDTIIHRLQTHISILEQQHQQPSQGYFSYNDASSFHEQYSMTKTSTDEVDGLEKLLQKREYELQQIREQLDETRRESEEKVRRTIEEFNDVENKLTAVRRERDEFRRKLQQVQDENDLMKSYMNRLPTEIEKTRRTKGKN